MMEKRYQQAIKLMQANKWYQAEHALKIARNYKDVCVLERYVRAVVKLDLAGQTISREQYHDILDLLNQIPNEYQGDFRQDIDRFRKKVLQTSGIKEGDNGVDTTYNGLRLVKIGGKHVYIDYEALQPPFGDLPER